MNRPNSCHGLDLALFYSDALEGLLIINRSKIVNRFAAEWCHSLQEILLDCDHRYKTIDSGFSKNSEAAKVARPSPHMHDKYLIYFGLPAFLIWFAQQKVVRLQLHDLKVHNMHFRKKNNVPRVAKTIWLASRR